MMKNKMMKNKIGQVCQPDIYPSLSALMWMVIMLCASCDDSDYQLPEDSETALQLPEDSETALQLPEDSETAQQLPEDSETAQQLPEDSETAQQLPEDSETAQKKTMQENCPDLIRFFDDCKNQDPDFWRPSQISISRECEQTLYTDTLSLWIECWMMISDTCRRNHIALPQTANSCLRFSACMQTCNL